MLLGFEPMNPGKIILVTKWKGFANKMEKLSRTNLVHQCKFCLFGDYFNNLTLFTCAKQVYQLSNCCCCPVITVIVHDHSTPFKKFWA